MINILRLTESDLHRIVEESVRRIISEETEYTEKDLERIKAELRKARAKKDVQSIIRLGREYNDATI